jgi:two-component system sensor histidine kinase/response regulator
LVVDDNATNRRILTEMATNWRMLPVAADGAVPALRMIEEARQAETPFRLLLLDANMPGMDGFGVAERIAEYPVADRPAIIMLTSAGRRGDAARCRELGVSAYLTKPTKQSSLLDAIMTVLGSDVSNDTESPLVTRHTLRESMHPLSVLLAEDNLVNQKIAVTMLEKRGHTVTVGGDGVEVLALLEDSGSQPFDLILMDVQMPGMDGFQATASIRDREKTHGGHIPIIALTAHAMKGDKESCLEAGMDAYVSKPIHIDELLNAMAGLCDHARTDVKLESIHHAAKRPQGSPSFDPAVAMASVDGDLELLAEVVELLKEDSPQTMDTIREAIRGGDANGLNRSAHALKGSVGNFGAHIAVELALALETMGKQQELTDAEDTANALEAELSRLIAALDAYVEGDAS